MGKRLGSKSKGEMLCRQILEEIFKEEFPCVRPNFLKNPETKRNLEFDCYNHQLRVACEYHGAQHYIFPNRYHKTIEEFYQQVRRDEYKKDLCDQYKITLIIVPYTIPYRDIKSYIIKKLQDAGVVE